MFKTFGENNITLDEISKSTKIDKEFLLMLLNNEGQMVENISRLIQFANLRLTLVKYKMKFHTTYHVSKDVIMFCRIVEPKCNISYDKITGEFFNLNFKRKRIEKKLSTIEKQQVLADFKSFKETHIDKLYDEKFMQRINQLNSV
ncbi:hypothetical protein M1M25_gp021 [Tenacibaculum phage Gundel_1]|uniref:Uncharacterized protein n=1 Tax=Tenacibaculum phage Gundel_1 TaxID=2745672 RepID=A0A8E5EC33_9CAUD|nr:hypothetical protein M1M25_gp021 [Tenacibaculum phage Gundel_1]QQV91452.1 hypothetical protein Gundel1_21 [Tenacibaculum phage Gundel_1]